MNPLYQQYQQGQQYNAGPNNFMQRFSQFKQMFNGDPKAQIQQMLNSGRISQSQYNQAVQMANQFMKMMK